MFCTSTSTPTDGSTCDSASTASTAWKNVPPGAAVRLGDLDAHHAQVEQLVDERARELRVLVHLADERRDLAARELEHAVAEQQLVLFEGGESPAGGRGGWIGHGSLGCVAGRASLECREAAARAEPSSK